jgi:anaerobic ribonucleoside-triphosphate reductase activating protein
VSNQEIRLNLSAWQERSVVNGPGRRYVIWVQGCPIGCVGCFSPETHAPEANHVVTIEELAERILTTPNIEGVTYSGGEPMVQAHGLVLLSERLRPAGLTIVCYTGYTLEALRARNDPWVERLLSYADILIDGPYVHDKATPLLWRGSSNQRVHFLTDTYRRLAEQVKSQTAAVEFTVGSKGFTTSGTWPEGFLQRLEAKLRR